MNQHTWSPEQQAIFNALGDPTLRHLLVVASAGSGKTTTIVQCTAQLNPYVAHRFLAFNKSIATELESRLPRHCVASTFHSAGMGALKRAGIKSRIDAQKTNYLLRKMGLSKTDFQTYASAACRLVSYAKNAGLGALHSADTLAFQRLLTHFDVQHEGNDAELISIASKLLYSSNNEMSFIDFDDMPYQPLRMGLPFDKVATLFVDEAQDTNEIQRAILRRMLAPTGRLVAVGDPSQSIYGFRGASSDAMSLLRDEFAMTVLPLSVSYRCSVAVVREAQLYDKGLTL
jgi:DNA helicase-2/ATP-dependent DNA helicase PcrA